MCSLEKRKELAVRQMRAAAVLYEMREKAEKDMAEDDDIRNKTYLRCQSDFRYELLKHSFELTAAAEEQDVRNEIMEELI